jgi:hypothetical protein
MIQGKHRNIILGTVTVAATLIAVTFIPRHKPKQTPPTAKEMAQNECSLAAYKKYLQGQFTLNTPNASDPLSILSVERVTAKRRLQEQFCLEFVRCLSEKPENDSSAVVEATRFDTCLKNETLEEYDAVPRDESDDTPNRDD